jgi:formate-dependent nitrite reductase cytochrome c552 subunit
LIAAASAGAVRWRRKLAEAVALAKLHGSEAVDEALAAAADAGRFADGDLAAILAHRGATVIAFPARASEERSLQRSTRAWEGFGA